MGNSRITTPAQLADIIKEDPKTFIEAYEEAHKKYQEQQLDKKFEKPAQIETDGRVTFGDPKAPVAIVEFSDFQCPPCAGTSKYLKSLIKEYEGKVKLVFRHFPLDFHKMAKPAAICFEAIAREDHEKARKFHDTLFENIQDHTALQDEKIIESTLQTLIKEVGVDVKKITENKKEAEKIVQKDLREASHLKVSGTPTLFINGIQPPFDPKGIEAVIERHLKEL